MNKIILILSGIAAAILLLVGTFVTAAGMLGAELHELPAIGGLFPEPPVAAIDPSLNELNTSVEEQVDADIRSPEQVMDHSSSPLHAFLLPNPFSTDQLEELESQLKTRLNAIAEREKELDARQLDLEESQRHLAALQRELESVRSGLIEERDETVALQEENKIKDAASAEERVESFKLMSSLFAEGDVDVKSQMLLDMYPPKEIGLVLAGLPPERVAVLMAGIRTAAPDVLSAVETSYRAEYTK
ncbi:MAG: hypothetical protein GY930_10835 [bacterium]|nr:hypothetical protein [bacterium]